MHSETTPGTEVFHASWRSGALRLGLLSLAMAAMMGAVSTSIGTKALSLIHI